MTDYATGAGDRYDQAAEWFLRLQRGALSAAEHDEFARWMENGLNASAYESVDFAWSCADEAAVRPASKDDSARADAMTAEAYKAAPRRGAWRPAAAAVAAIVVVVGMGSIFMARESGAPGPGMALAERAPVEAAGPEAYATAVGERSTIVLADGSQVMLNTDTRLEVSYSETERRIDLQQGQALFDVAKNPDRPFIVQAAGREVTALGTAFDVRAESRTLRVTLIEGSVSVEDAELEPAAAPETPTRLKPGEQYVAEGGAEPEVRLAQIDHVTSWREGKLIFSDEPLSEAVAEVNRYSARKIVLADAALGDLRVSGVFRTGRTDSFVQAVSTYFPVQAKETAPGRIVLQPSGA